MKKFILIVLFFLIVNTIYAQNASENKKEKVTKEQVKREVPNGIKFRGKIIHHSCAAMIVQSLDNKTIGEDFKYGKRVYRNCINVINKDEIIVNGKVANFITISSNEANLSEEICTMYVKTPSIYAFLKVLK